MTEPRLAARLRDLCDAVWAGVDAQRDLLAELARLAHDFRSLDAAGREAVRAHLGAREASALWTIAALSVESALRTSDARRLEDALVAHAIEDFRIDWRDSVRGVAMIWWAMDRLGVPPEQLMPHAALFSEAGRRRLESFLVDPSYLLSLASFGLEVVEDENGLRFRELPPRSLGL